ncbi:unnamed protein product (macronuclear) [Paramecium tetraurelia]|uniref:RGS domain-containing protein n=1 Tax=Paramecium tetraurelia TaxID=5888 RepID=A0CAP9_PARTE|nr:uncharacterized protein GSPATT00036647001 [Paramecium tetraurelia]CAK67866.1 unnamed protein product [Paramecium tetraurelia]|eukprot:XP_001435263.1 hypothetical protein (macronuclear) [Paramecium tetraurelia strain d4-2]
MNKLQQYTDVYSFEPDLDQVLIEIIPDMIESVADLNETQIQDRLATKRVSSKTKTVTFNGMLLILLIFLVLTIVRWLMNKIDVRLLKYMLKDSALMLPMVFIILVFNYLLSSSVKQNLNIYGVLYYVDLDKFLMQIVTFIIVWFGVGIVFTFLWQHQSAINDEFEQLDAEQTHRLYENMYLYNDSNTYIIQEKVQYHSIRQQFIQPTDIPVINPRILRKDFNFAQYLNLNQRKIYTQILRINSFSIIPIILCMFLTYVFSSIIITVLLLLYYWVQKSNLYQIYTKIDAPYQYNPTPLQYRGIQAPPYINLPLQKNKSRLKQVIGSPQFNLRLLHSFIFIQIFWFAWLFYAHRVNNSILEHTWLSIFVSIASVNVTILTPMIVKVLTYTHLIADPYKVCVELQYNRQSLLEKVSHYLRFCNRKEDEQHSHNDVNQQDEVKEQEQEQDQEQDQNQEKDQYSLTVGQQQLIKYAFTCLINNEKEKYVKQAVEQYKKQLIENPNLLQVPIDSEEEEDLELELDEQSGSQEEDQEDQSQNRQQQQNANQQQGQPKDINEALKEYEQKIVAKLTESSSINVNQLNDLKKYVDCNLPLWYMVLMVDKYFKLNNPLVDTIRYNDLCNYSGFNQYVLETGDMYPQQIEVMTLTQLKEYLMSFFTEQEAEEVTMEYSFQEQMVNFEQFYQFIENNIVLFPK